MPNSPSASRRSACTPDSVVLHSSLLSSVQFSILFFFSYWGIKSGCSIPDAIIQVTRGITWSDFLVMLLIQPRMLLAFISCRALFVYVWPLSPRLSKSFLAEQYPSHSAPVWRKQHVLLPMSLLNYTTCLLVHSSSLSRLLWMAAPYFKRINCKPRLESSIAFNDVHDQQLNKEMWRYQTDFRTDTRNITIWRPVVLPTNYNLPSSNT